MIMASLSFLDARFLFCVMALREQEKTSAVVRDSFRWSWIVKTRSSALGQRT